MKGRAGDFHALQRVFLRLRACPLQKIRAMMPAGIPCAGVDRHAAFRAVSPQVIADEHRPHGGRFLADALQQRAIKHVPEISFFGEIPKPAAVVAVRAGRDERREIAPFRALVHFVNKPAVIHPGFLRVGKLAVADDDSDLLAFVFGDMRAIADFFPAHRLIRLDVIAIHHDVLKAHAFQRGDHFHAEPHFRRPKAGELLAPERVAADAEPARGLLFPIGLRNKRKHGMIIARAEDFEQAGILQMPQQIAAFDKAVGSALKIRTRQRFQQRPRHRKMHAGDILILPNRARHAV